MLILAYSRPTCEAAAKQPFLQQQQSNYADKGTSVLGWAEGASRSGRVGLRPVSCSECTLSDVRGEQGKKRMPDWKGKAWAIQDRGAPCLPRLFNAPGTCNNSHLLSHSLQKWFGMHNCYLESMVVNKRQPVTSWCRGFCPPLSTSEKAINPTFYLDKLTMKHHTFFPLWRQRC